MKSHLILLLAALAAVSSFAVARSGPEQNNADHKIEILEKDITATRARLEQVSADLAETRAALDGALKYLADQSASAKKMAQTLDDSEQAGFTFGINPDSRKILLKGWRDDLAAAQKTVPSLPAAKPAAKDAKVPGGN
jgi:hypothetical protein